MFRGVLKRLTGWFSSKDADDGNADDTRFIPSILDASVRYAHGGNSTGGEREIAKLDEDARRLEEQHHEK